MDSVSYLSVSLGSNIRGRGKRLRIDEYTAHLHQPPYVLSIRESWSRYRTSNIFILYRTQNFPCAFLRDENAKRKESIHNTPFSTVECRLPNSVCPRLWTSRRVAQRPAPNRPVEWFDQRRINTLIVSECRTSSIRKTSGHKIMTRIPAIWDIYEKTEAEGK